MYRRACLRHIPGVHPEDARNFALVVEHELSSRLFQPYKNDFRQRPRELPCDDRSPRWFREFCLFLEKDGSNSGLGTMFRVIDEARRARAGILGEFADWIKKTSTISG